MAKHGRADVAVRLTDAEAIVAAATLLQAKAEAVSELWCALAPVRAKFKLHPSSQLDLAALSKQLTTYRLSPAARELLAAIFGRPNQQPAAWTHALSALCRMGPDAR